MSTWADYIGIPYLAGGRTREGCDCWGLVRLIYAERYGIDLPSYSVSDTPAGQERDVAHGAADGSWDVVEQPDEGDVLVLRQMGFAGHVGVCDGAGGFVHTEEGIGSVRQELGDIRWARRIVSIHRHRALGGVRVVARQSPLTDAREVFTVEPGATLEAIVLRAVGPRWYDLAHVCVDGEPYPRETWAATCPAHGRLVAITVVPGGRGNAMLRTVLTIAVMVWAGGAGGRLFSGLFGHGARALNYGRALAGAVGLLAVEALCPPPRPRLDGLSGTGQSNVYSITGSQNQMMPYGAIPVVLGTHKIYPPYAAKPYTMLVGSDQYLCCLFAVGYGPLTISDLKIGDTAIASFSDVSYEIKEGTGADTAITLFPETVTETALDVALTYAGSYQTRATAADTDEAIVDIAFPSGLVIYNASGQPTAHAVAVEITYRDTGGSGGWSNPLGYFVSGVTLTVQGNANFHVGRHDLVFTGGGGTGAAGYAEVICGDITGHGKVNRVVLTSYGNGYTGTPTVTIDDTGTGATVTASMTEGYIFTAASPTPIRHGFTITFPSRDQWDVRIRRLTADAVSASQVDTTYWTTLRSVKNTAPVTTPYNLAKIALKIKATGQLNGTIGTFSCVASSRGYEWNSGTSTWDADQDINNPADIYRLLLQHPCNAAAVADARIDLTKLATWSEFCTTKGFTFNAVLDSVETLRDRLNAVAAVGRASPCMSNNKFSVVIDDTQSTPVQVFTPRNTISFSGRRTFITKPHAFRCRFINEDNDYLQEERIVYADGYTSANATVFEQLEMFGATDSDHVWKLARYHLACAENRQEQFEIEADWEHIVCTRGDLVRLVHDVPLIGVASGRVTQVHADWIEVDELCTMDGASTYAVQTRSTAGVVTQWTTTTINGSTRVLTRSGGSAFTSAVGDLFVFGVSGSVATDCLITSIEPTSDLSARIGLVPYVSGVYTADSGSVPAYTAQMTIPPDLLPPNPPRTLVAAEHLYRSGGVLMQGCTLSWTHPDNVVVERYEAEVLRPDGEAYEPIGSTTGTSIMLSPAPAGTYSFRVRSWAGSQSLMGPRPSEWAALADEDLDSLMDAAPDAVTGLRLGYRGGNPVLTWTAVTDTRDVTYEVRRLRQGADSLSWVAVATVTDPEYAPEEAGYYSVVAVCNAVYSASWPVALAPFRSLNTPNVKATHTEQTDWAGTLGGSVMPSPPLHADWPTSWTPQECPAVTAWDEDWDGTTEPDASGWTLGGTDLATVVDGHLEIGSTTPCYYKRASGATGNEWTVVEACLRVVEGDVAVVQVFSDYFDSMVRVNVAYDRIIVGAPILTTDSAAGLTILRDMESVPRTIRLECREGVRVYLDGELVAVCDGEAGYTSAAAEVYFGRYNTITAAAGQEWYGVRFDYVTNTQDYTPDGWSSVGTPAAQDPGSLNEYALYGAVTASGDNGYKQNPTMASGDCLILQIPLVTMTSSAVIGFFMQLTNSASGKGVRFKFDNGTVKSYDPSTWPYTLIDSAAGHDIDQPSILTAILWGSTYWLTIDDELVMTGSAGGDGAFNDDVRWGVYDDVGGGSIFAGVAGAHLYQAETLPAGLVLMPGDTGTYQIAAGDVVDLTYEAESLVDGVVSASVVASDDLYLVTDLYDVEDLYSGVTEDVRTDYAVQQIRCQHDDATWDDWTTLVPGNYHADQFDLRLNLTAPDHDRLFVRGWSWEVDMPDRRDQYTVAASSSGAVTQTFDPVFQATPSSVVGTILLEQAGDHLEIDSLTTSGCSVSVYNAGSRVDRTVYLLVSGY